MSTREKGGSHLFQMETDAHGRSQPRPEHTGAVGGFQSGVPSPPIAFSVQQTSPAVPPGDEQAACFSQGLSLSPHHPAFYGKWFCSRENTGTKFSPSATVGPPQGRLEVEKLPPHLHLSAVCLKLPTREPPISSAQSTSSWNNEIAVGSRCKNLLGGHVYVQPRWDSFEVLSAVSFLP